MNQRSFWRRAQERVRYGALCEIDDEIAELERKLAELRERRRTLQLKTMRGPAGWTGSTWGRSAMNPNSTPDSLWEHDIDTERGTLIAPVNDCDSCGGAAPEGECPKSERSCGHHCNHSWTHDTCHWCGIEFGEAAA